MFRAYKFLSMAADKYHIQAMEKVAYPYLVRGCFVIEQENSQRLICKMTVSYNLVWLFL